MWTRFLGGFLVCMAFSAIFMALAGAMIITMTFGKHLAMDTFGWSYGVSSIFGVMMGFVVISIFGGIMVAFDKN